MPRGALTSLVIRRPDDLHVHLRQGAALTQTVPELAAVFGRVVAMPNLVPPIRTATDAETYATEIHAVASAAGYPAFRALVPLYLTQETTADDIVVAAARGVLAAKLYPLGATTNSQSGVQDLAAMDDVFGAMAAVGMILQVHGEVVDPDVDIFDREAVFVARVLGPLLARFPTLRVVIEHATTAAAIELARAHSADRVGVTITPQHLLYDRSAIFAGGLRPHLYCLPVPKTRQDRQALIDAAISRDPRFFLGSDSAPHPIAKKEAACCAAGVYSGPIVLPLYAEVFAEAGKLKHLEAFASHFGADFYRLPRNQDYVELKPSPWLVPTTVSLGGQLAAPFRAGELVQWIVSALS